MAEDPDLRAARLGLLATISALAAPVLDWQALGTSPQPGRVMAAISGDAGPRWRPGSDQRAEAFAEADSRRAEVDVGVDIRVRALRPR